MKKILFIDWHIETNCFSPRRTNLKDFKDFFYAIEEEDVLRFSKKYKGQFLGAKKAMAKYGKGEFELIPIYSSWGIPNGPVEKDTFEHFYHLALEGIRAHKADIAGIYLSLHGATMVDGHPDSESVFMEMIREELGNDIPIGLSLDLHANVSQRNVELANFVIGYKTNPHRDRHKTGYKAIKMLLATIRGKIRPRTVIKKMRMLQGCGTGTDILAPMRRFFWWERKKWESQKGILDASAFMVHFWMDTPDLGWSMLVTVDGDEHLDKGNKIAEEMANYCWDRRNFRVPPFYSTEEAIMGAREMGWLRKTGPAFFCDMSDAVPAGAPGENTSILKAILAHGSDLISYIPVKDTDVHNELINIPIGTTVHIEVGGKTDTRFNTPATFEGEVIFKKECEFYSAIVLRNKGTHLILTDKGFPGFFPKQYQELGLKLLKADIVVTKNFFPFRFFQAPYIRKVFNIITTGVTNINVHEIEYTRIPRPIYPLDDIQDWRW